jgi:hypothetical protein
MFERKEVIAKFKDKSKEGHENHMTLYALQDKSKTRTVFRWYKGVFHFKTLESLEDALKVLKGLNGLLFVHDSDYKNAIFKAQGVLTHD